MALLFCDGFDHYVTADILKKWNAYPNNACTVLTTSGRRGGGCLSINSTSDVIKVIPASGTLIIGQAIWSPLGTNNFQVVSFFDGTATNPQLTVSCDTSGRLVVYRGAAGSGTLLATSLSVIAASSWAYVEVKVVFGNTGSYEVRVNGTAVLSATGVDTTMTANNTASGIGFGYAFGNGSLWSALNYKDDLYVCDGTGSVNNDFLGDCRVDALYPNADGTYAAFTCSTGTSHFALVDEATPNTTDYVSAGVVGNKDSYAFTDLATAATVFGVQVCNAALKDDVGSRSVANLVRSGTTDAISTGVPLSTSLLYYCSIHELDPATGAAWTQAGVNAAQFGTVVAA